MPRKIQAISFDVGGTLIETWPSVGQIYARCASRHGIVAAPEILEQQFRDAWRAKSNFDYSRSAWQRLVQQTFAGFAPDPLPTTFFAQLYEYFSRTEAWHIYPEVLPTLEVLAHKSCKLAIVSNWDERLRPLLDQLQLGRFFQVIGISSEIGATKPSLQIFSRVQAALSLPPSAILHVGDSWTEDVAGARAAGWQAVHLCRKQTGAQPEAITTLRALWELV